MVLDIAPNDGGRDGRRKRYLHRVQALFVDKHLSNIGERYDFDSIRVGIQPFSSGGEVSVFKTINWAFDYLELETQHISVQPCMV